MNKRHTVIIVVLICALAILSVGYWLANQYTFSYIDVECIDIQATNWDIPLTRAEVNFTAKSVFRTPGVIIIEQVEINGTEVDAYPEYPQLRTGDSVLLKIYYPYEYNTKYLFKFISQTGANYTALETTPSD